MPSAVPYVQPRWSPLRANNNNKHYSQVVRVGNRRTTVVDLASDRVGGLEGDAGQCERAC
jgi:hypothetical protein